MRPLRGLKVLEFAPHYPGQYLTRLLAHLGATVTKVESPAGDSNRRIAPYVADDVGFLYAASNREKKIQRIDLRTDAGRRKIRPLLKKADIVVQAYRPGTAKKLGIDWAACRAANPRVLYVELSGWGPEGPLSGRHGHDLAYQAAAGMLDPMRPSFPTVGVADLFGTFWAATTLLAALTETKKTRKGRRIEISVAGSALAASQLARAAANTVQGPPEFMRGMDPYYNLYRCKDGKFLALAVVEESRKTAASEVLGIASARPAITDLASAFETRTRDEWVLQLVASDVPCAPVLSPTEAVAFLDGSGALLPPVDLVGVTRRRPGTARAKA